MGALPPHPADRRRSSMQKFLPFVKGILDFLDGLSPSAIRLLFRTLSYLAVKDNGIACSVDDEIVILMRKLLTSANSATKVIGVIAAVTTAACLASAWGGNPATPSRAKAGVDLGKLVVEACARSAVSMSLVYDELASAVQAYSCDQALLVWISEHVTCDFENVFLLDIDDKGVAQTSSQLPQGTGGPAIQTEHNLDGKEAPITLALAQILMTTSSPRREQVVCICSLFRLLQIIEIKQTKSLGGVDALLGCPVQMIKLEPDMPGADGTLVLSCLYHTINWFIEVVNAFSIVNDKEMQIKVVQRAEKVVQLMSQFDEVHQRAAIAASDAAAVAPIYL